MRPISLDLEDVLALHDLHLQRYGGSAGIRDRGLLESAVAQAKVSFGGDYLHADLAAMTAAYLVSIVKNHPFVDGNKRAGLASALTFLDLNGIAIDHSSALLYDTTMAVAEGRLDKVELAEVFQGLASSKG
jgi:death-on-curing protein